MSWFGNKQNTAVQQPASTMSTQVGGLASNVNAVLTSNSNYPSNVLVASQYPASIYAGSSGIGSFNIGYQSNDIISFRDTSNKEIVKLNADGTVTWNQEIKVDEAAEAFARCLRLGAEVSMGITKKVKSEMRDTVFEEIIALAKTKGVLTLDDLTFMYEASKIMEKLKGGRE